MYCMMHCNRVESTALLVVDICVQGMIDLAHNHIFKYIYPNTQTLGDILKDDRVCLTCYKSHLVILKENQPISKDEDLKVLIDTLGRQTTTMGNAQNIICAATIRMLVTVGKMLMGNRAMLLPTIHSDFIHYARGLFAARGMQDPQELKSISSRSVLSEITAKYQHHVTYTCKVRKYCTLMYRHNSDILSLLSEVLWKLKQAHVELKQAHVEQIKPCYIFNTLLPAQ